MKRLVTLILIFLATTATSSAKNKVAFLNVASPDYHIEVILDSAPTGDYLDKTKYRVVSLTSNLPGGEWKWIGLSEVRISPGNSRIILIPEIPADVQNAAQLMLLVGSEPGVMRTKQYEPPKEALQKSTKEASDLYLNLSFSPGINSPQQYSIDAALGTLFPILPSSDSNFGSFGFLAAVKTDKRKKADPDSYRVFGVYERPLTASSLWPLQGVIFTWLFAGTEFERQAKNTNFISSPLLDFPLRLRGSTIHNQKQIVPILTPEIGLEIGKNFENAVNSGGQGIIARGIVGGNLSVIFSPKLKLFQAIHLTSGYKLRLPATDEVFTLTKLDAKGQTVDAPSLNTKPRHYIKNELGFTLWDPLSFTITHEYGEIPPAFRLVDHKVSVGLTLAVQQTNKISAALTTK
jgi:hypothetical protein